MSKKLLAKVLRLILKNQNHILHELASMHSSGRIHTGHFSRDKISEKLQSETYDTIKTLGLIKDG